MHVYDSIARSGGVDWRVKLLLQWLSDESAARGGEDSRLDTSAWKVMHYAADQVPQQDNGTDCGESIT